MQKLKPIDHKSRGTFVSYILLMERCKKKEEDEESFRNIFFSDEADFHLGGYVYKRKCRIWKSASNTGEVKPLHHQRVTVWFGFWTSGPEVSLTRIFFKNEAGNAVSVVGNWYISMIWNVLCGELGDIDVQLMWSRQDDATLHTSNEALNFLWERFQNRIILRRGNISWPPKSSDLTPLCFFLWGLLEENVYADNNDSRPSW